MTQGSPQIVPQFNLKGLSVLDVNRISGGQKSWGMTARVCVESNESRLVKPPLPQYDSR
jgi:hypothetical protein